MSTNIPFPEAPVADYHISHVVFEKPYDVVWEWLSNPMNFATLYPNWVAEIVQVTDDRFEIVTPPPPTRLHLALYTDRELGVIDLDISPGERSRSRVLPLGPDRTVQIHVAVKGSQPEALFRSIAENTDRDYRHAKRVIETHAASTE